MGWEGMSADKNDESVYWLEEISIPDMRYDKNAKASSGIIAWAQLFHDLKVSRSWKNCWGPRNSQVYPIKDSNINVAVTISNSIYLVFKKENEKKMATDILSHNKTHCAHSESIFPHNVTCLPLISWQNLQRKAMLTVHYYFGVSRGIIHSHILWRECSIYRTYSQL